jgi:transglutaminase-like putative cysteine protease
VIVTFGAPSFERGPGGDRVSTRKARFRSQPDQIRFLREMVDEYRGHHAIRARARDIAFRQYLCPPKDQLAQALAIGSWVQRNITYVNELPEIFQTPTTTVSTGYGDCDDFTTLICSMLESIGIESELVGMEWGGTFKHIFPRAVLPYANPPQRLALDATLPSPVSMRTDPIAVARARGNNVRVFVA